MSSTKVTSSPRHFIRWPVGMPIQTPAQLLWEVFSHAEITTLLMTHTPTTTVWYSFIYTDELRQYTVNTNACSLKYQQEVIPNEDWEWECNVLPIAPQRPLVWLTWGGVDVSHGRDSAVGAGGSGPGTVVPGGHGGGGGTGSHRLVLAVGSSHYNRPGIRHTHSLTTFSQPQNVRT